jgi:hypothetical protein
LTSRPSPRSSTSWLMRLGANDFLAYRHGYSHREAPAKRAAKRRSEPLKAVIKLSLCHSCVIVLGPRLRRAFGGAVAMPKHRVFEGLWHSKFGAMIALISRRNQNQRMPCPKKETRYFDHSLRRPVTRADKLTPRLVLSFKLLEVY